MSFFTQKLGDMLDSQDLAHHVTSDKASICSFSTVPIEEARLEARTQPGIAWPLLRGRWGS